ncbi:metallophosphoesterase [Streptomyces sp. DSM 44917]|uniref:Metallophosphoesterase n=1 Tax=Streptomyces boetiae TaxID=3075541 RepID=A0ABU2L9B9_9ACTN|nr:metallophosphoesterase [Streptomyces sp. DSM 44917]MDT0308166.1 metallophosphoesterase [Streptomyces sp. DSM 44917]
MRIVLAIPISLVLAVIHWYLWRRLVRDVSRPGGAYRRAGTLALVVLPVLTIVASLGREIGVPFPVLRVISWPGQYWLVSLLYLLLCLAPGELLRLVLLRGRRRAARAARDGGTPGTLPAARTAAPAPAPDGAGTYASGGGRLAPSGRTGHAPGPGGSATAVALATDPAAAAGAFTRTAPSGGGEPPASTGAPGGGGRAGGGTAPAEEAVGDGAGAPRGAATPGTPGGAGAGTRATAGVAVRSGSGGAATAEPATAPARADACTETSAAPGTPADGAASAGGAEHGPARGRPAGNAPEGSAGGAGAPRADASAGAETAGADRGPDSADAAGPGRRLVVARGIAIGAGAVTAGVLGYGTYAARRLRTRHVSVALDRLPRAAHGYRIAVVSDIHLGPVLGAAHSRRVVEAVNRTEPDLIAVVGDLVDAEVNDLRSAAAPLAGLRARDGAFFVTGNHEYYVDTASWVEHVRELGLTPLTNDRRELPYFDLAGINDVDGEGTAFGGPDFEAALGDRDPRRTAVLMAHQPVAIHDAVDHGVDLQLSGHTHGGQLWPLTYVAGLANPTLAGLERYGDTQLYVTRGAGAFGAPVRVGADPDITVLRLTSGRA